MGGCLSTANNNKTPSADAFFGVDVSSGREEGLSSSKPPPPKPAAILQPPVDHDAQPVPSRTTQSKPVFVPPPSPEVPEREKIMAAAATTTTTTTTPPRERANNNRIDSATDTDQPVAPKRPPPTTILQQQQHDDDIIEEAKEGEQFLDVYDIGRELGNGAFSTVMVAIHKKARREFAVKVIDRTKMQWGGRDALQDEIENMKKLKNAPCVVQFQDVFQEHDICYLVIEMIVGGELFDRIIAKGTFTEGEARDASRCVLEALAHMHDKRIAHRDMKPENLLLVDTHNTTPVKLSDFGFAKAVETKNSCRTLCGTPGYLAPEVLERWPAYDVACDVWSFGVILFLMIGGYLPFDPNASNDINAVFERTRNGRYNFYPQRWGNVSKMAKDLVSRCLNINPNRRMTAKEALEHEWMTVGEAKLSTSNIDTTMLKSVLQERPHTEDNKPKEERRRNRVKELNDEFSVFLDKNKANSIVSHMTGAHKTIATAATKFKNDSSSGKTFQQCYRKKEQLGKGAFATVHRAVHLRFNETFAVKEIDITKLKPRELKALEDEISVLKFVRGAPTIIRMYDVFREPDKFFLVTEEMKGGDLLSRIVEKEAYTEAEARATCRHVFEAVRYCHRKRIAHRDIKLDNLLLVEKNDESTLKLADFGFAKRCGKKGLTTMCGTPNYMAPEIFDLPEGGYDFRCDMWSVGVVVYCLLGGYLPFEGDIRAIAKKVKKGKFKFHDEYWKDISTSAKSMISQMLQVNTNKRLSAEAALSCEWMGLDEDQLTTIDLSACKANIKEKANLKGLVKGIINAKKLLGEGGDNESDFLHADDLDAVSEEEEKEEKFIENYELLQQIGEGEFAEIHIAIHRQSNREVAVKKVCRHHLVESDVAALDDEIAVMRAISGSMHVISLEGMYEDDEFTHLVMERVYGTVLIDKLMEKKRYTEGDAKDVIRNLLLGVHHCHSKRVAIRNLKLESLLLPDDDETKVRITDFECAKIVTFPNSLKTQCGTQEYVAPEVLENNPAYDMKCDMWTVGVIVFIMLGGYYPFRGKSEMDVLRKVRYGEFKFHPKMWKNITDDAKDLVKRMMTVDPEERIMATDALQSPWIRTDSLRLSIELNENYGELFQEFSEVQANAKFNHDTQVVKAMNR